MRATYGMRPSFEVRVWHETKLCRPGMASDQAMWATYGMRPTYAGPVWNETKLCGPRME
ncbi:hypothetical protein DPMN_170965 [Dreissena polymorpha]|uniref:Uncharacterized protein n=1 Tax=Dreissena polymorpha TaxID=45954 RepID=A0A9D4DZG2_DREPO|nr:hypothetical protein DPMN_170965 [Dreissena polymorpha]